MSSQLETNYEERRSIAEQEQNRTVHRNEK